MCLDLYKFAILFPTVKLQLGHSFLKLIYRLQIGAFRLLFLSCTCNFIPNSQSNLKLGFLNVAPAGLFNFTQFIKEIENWDFEYYLSLYFQIFPNSLKSWEIVIF